MCEPVTIGAIVAGTAVSAYGQYRQGQAAESAGRANARVAMLQAGDALQRGASEARQVEIEGRQIGASARVAMGKSGVEGGTTDAVELASAVAVGQDVDAIKANAAREAWGLKQQARQMRQQGREAKTAGILGALGTGLSGAGSAGSAYASYRRGQ